MLPCVGLAANPTATTQALRKFLEEFVCERIKDANRRRTLSPSAFWHSEDTLCLRLGTSQALTNADGDLSTRACLHAFPDWTSERMAAGCRRYGAGDIGCRCGGSQRTARRAASRVNHPFRKNFQRFAAVGQSYASCTICAGLLATPRLPRWANAADCRRHGGPPPMRRLARATLEELLRRRCIPIINENDTVTVDELKFGDNDGLAARVAVKMQADALVLLSDVDGVFSAGPKETTPDLPRLYCSHREGRARSRRAIMSDFPNRLRS